MSQLPSRTPEIDIDECAEKIGGKMNMILIAAQRARDIRNKTRKSTDMPHMNYATEALLDIQNDVIGADYGTKRLLDENDDQFNFKDDTDI